MPAMAAEQSRLWELILTLSERLEPTQWSLVGGQMVALHALNAGVTWPRVTRDIDMLAATPSVRRRNDRWMASTSSPARSKTALRGGLRRFHAGPLAVT